MKTLLIGIVLFASCSLQTYAHQFAARIDSSPETEPFSQDTTYFVTAEQFPEPIGGLAALQKAIVYPEIVKRAGIEGTVYLKAFIDEDGNVVKTEIVKGVHPALDRAAATAVEKTKFQPAKQRGKSIKFVLSVPIRFRLSDKGESIKHGLYQGNYPVNAGAIEIPPTAQWKAMNTEAHKDKVLMVLQDEWSKTNGFWPVMSYLTPKEALRLAEQLKHAAEKIKETPAK